MEYHLTLAVLRSCSHIHIECIMVKVYLDREWRNLKRFSLSISIGLPPGCQKALEAMSQELGDMNPAFTIRRQLQHAQEEMEQIEQLRHVSARLLPTWLHPLPATASPCSVYPHRLLRVAWRWRSLMTFRLPWKMAWCCAIWLITCVPDPFPAFMSLLPQSYVWTCYHLTPLHVHFSVLFLCLFVTSRTSTFLNHGIHYSVMLLPFSLSYPLQSVGGMLRIFWRPAGRSEWNRWLFWQCKCMAACCMPVASQLAWSMFSCICLFKYP